VGGDLVAFWRIRDNEYLYVIALANESCFRGGNLEITYSEDTAYT
jgi:hypothetical protein